MIIRNILVLAVLLGREKRVRIYILVHVSIGPHFFSVTSFIFSVEDYIFLVNKSLLSFTGPRTSIKEWKEVTTRMKKNESI